MEKIVPINKKRLWLLMTAIWIIIVSIYFYSPIKQGISDFEPFYNSHLKAKQRKSFLQCLKEHGTSYAELLRINEKRCSAQVSQTCSKQKSPFCSRELRMDICIHSSSDDCKHFYVINSIEQLGKNSSFERTKEKLVFYLSKRYSRPLIHALILVLFVPILIWFSPSIAKKLYQWIRS